MDQKITDPTVVHQTAASLYNEESRNWNSVNLILCSGPSIRTYDLILKNEQGEIILKTPLDSISDLQKEKSSFIFKALTLLVGPKKYWLSSFPNRERTFNLIEHFWREYLFHTSEESKVQEASDYSDALRSVYDSEEALSHSAILLKRQSEQLNHGNSVLEEIHNDLGVAKKLLTNLESWVGRVGLSKKQSVPSSKHLESDQTSRSVGLQGKKNEEFRKLSKHFNVLYCCDNTHLVSKSSDKDCLPGKLIISSIDLSLLDSKGNSVVTFKNREITFVNIVNNWECEVIQRKIGAKDVQISIICAKLQSLSLTFYNLLGASKVNRPKFESGNNAFGPEKNSSTSHDYSSSASAAMGETSWNPASNDSSSQCQQVQFQESQLDMESEKELRRSIARMKSMALDIGCELEEQNENVSSMVQSTEDATFVTKACIKRTNRLM